MGLCSLKAQCKLDPSTGRLVEVLQHGYASDAVVSILDGVQECGAHLQIKWLVYSS